MKSKNSRNREKLAYKTDKYTSSFQQYKTIKSFANDILKVWKAWKVISFLRRVDKTRGEGRGGGGKLRQNTAQPCNIQVTVNQGMCHKSTQKHLP